MPTLLQINVVANWGSTGRIAEEIGQVAIAGGWKSYIAYGRGTPQSKSRLIRVGNDGDMYWHGLQSRLLDNHGLASKRATRKLITEIQEIKPDIVHLHNIHGYYLNYEILFQYLAEKDIPVVWTLHDCWAFTGHCAYFTLKGCEKWKTECRECPLQKRYPVSFFIDRSTRNYHTKKEVFTSIPRMIMVPVSEWLGGLVRSSFLSKYPVHPIYNGVDLQIFMPKSNKEEIRKFIEATQPYMLIGVASIWTSSKGIQDYYKLRNYLPIDKYAIVMVGLNKKQIQQLPKGIVGVSRTNSVHELAEYYSAADVVLNLSYQETFGMTTAEGLACGTPGVVYNATASPELINEETGLIVDPGNIVGVADAVRTITARGKQHYSAACRQRAELFFNKADRWKEYVDLYKSLIVFNQGN